MDAVFVTARLKSTRLPGKALIDVYGKPIIQYLLERLRHASQTRVIICTSTNPQDDPLDRFASSMGIDCFRGDEEDVLQRYLGCCERFNVDRAYMVYADEPMTDMDLIIRTFSMLDPMKKVWVKNDAYLDGTFGYGLTMEALREANRKKTSVRNEVWGPMLATMAIDIVANEPPYRIDKSQCRLTIDYPEDLTVFRTLVKRLGMSFLASSVPEFLALYRDLNCFSINGFRIAEYNDHIAVQGQLS